MKIKKFISLILIMPLLVIPVGLNQANALSPEEITAPSAVLMEPQTGRLIYEKNPHDIRPCASITKVMTLLLTMEAIENGQLKLTDTITASEHAASMGGSDIWLEPGETMSANDMIKAVNVASANDAAVALAEHLNGSEEIFVQKMNERAQQLGMYDTTFKNCNGLDEDGHLTSAYDVALMSVELIKHKEIFSYSTIWMDTLRNGKTQIVNTNKLLKSYPGATGLKTGTTGQAKSCISATATKNSLTMIAVVLGSETGKDRFDDATKLLDYGFSNFTMHTPKVDESILTPVKVINGMKNQIEIKADLPESLALEKGEQKSLKSENYIMDEIEAPVKAGQVLGKIVFKVSDQIISETDVVAKEDVEAISFSSVLNLLMSKLLG